MVPRSRLARAGATAAEIDRLELVINPADVKWFDTIDDAGMRSYVERMRRIWGPTADESDLEIVQAMLAPRR